MGRVFLVVIITAIIMGTKLVACQTGGFFFFFTRGALGNYKKKKQKGDKPYGGRLIVFFMGFLPLARVRCFKFPVHIGVSRQ